MLVPSIIEKHLDLYIEGLTKRGIADPEALLLEVIEKNNSRKQLQGQLDDLLQSSNKLSKDIGRFFKEGKKEEASAAKAESAKLKESIKVLTEESNQVNDALITLLHSIPNIPHKTVIAGSSEADNEVVKEGDVKLRELGTSKMPHWELLNLYDLADFDLGSKVTGAGFPFYKNRGARLVRGLINYFLDRAIEAGYEEVQPPILINEASGIGTGQLPDKEGQMYHLKADDLYLIPTSEVPITNMYRDTILEEGNLPIKHAGHTPCFRREAGSWGAHVRGLNRLHQFDKVEIVQITTAENSYQALEEMVAHVEELLIDLELPYRILRLCGGDLGFTAALTYDFEVFSAAQERWLEVSSVSNVESYQSNRLKLRVKKEDGKKELAHTLNGSALALPRIIAALLENNQFEGKIAMPQVLRPYLGFSDIVL
ncbi:MAG: serine--tRNA ligase [Bacteroidota bacterium]